jgi:hypothetical protein
MQRPLARERGEPEPQEASSAEAKGGMTGEDGCGRL